LYGSRRETGVGLRGPRSRPRAGVTDTEIRIGHIMPYTGPLAAFA